MTFRPLFYTWLALPFVVFSSMAFAQDASDGTLHVLRPLIHAEQDRAELCLEFDHALDDSDKARGVITIRLESSGKRIAVSQQGLNINAATLCLPSLDHRRSYRLTLSGLKGSEGEKLTEPYQFSFTVPDRKASLAFLSDLYSGGIMRWQNNDPVLRALNVEHAKIELYRISTLPLMTEAWRQHKQTTLAPSESAYFARDKGQLIWQNTLDIEDNPNAVVEQKIALREEVKDLSPGFYLVVASAVLPKNQNTKNDFVPLAAAWLLRSNLKIHALRDSDGLYAVAEKADASGVFSDVHVLLEDNKQQTLTEAKSSVDGTAHMPLATDKLNNATTLIGLADSGDVDFVDLSQNQKTNLLLPEVNASLQTDKTFYAPGTNADVALTAQDSQGQPLPLADSHLQLLRPDRSLLTSLPVPINKSGTSHIVLSVPPASGLWVLQWQGDDGRILTEAPLHITANEEAPHLDVSTDHTMITDNGGLNLNLTGTTASGKPAPYIAGQVNVAWVTPDSLFAGWNGYHFGGIEGGKTAATQTATFLTDAKGQAQLHIDLAPPTAGTALRAAQISIQSDPAAGTIDPKPILIPVKPTNFIVGIKPWVEDAQFAENSLARFDVVALDGDGKRVNADSLTYQIIEEGRSFDWYPDAGRWNYKPLEQKRRVGGGTLNLKAEGSNRIDWPVNAGTYQLVIRDAADKVLAQVPFGAGWSAGASDPVKTTVLTLISPQGDLHVGEEAKIRFKLDQPAMVTAVIADDHIRKIIHLAQPAGENTLSFVPDANWHGHVVLSVNARASSADGVLAVMTGQITLPLLHSGNTSKPTVEAAIQNTLPPLAVTGAELPVLKVGDQIQFVVNLKNNAAVAANYHYTFTALPGLKILEGGNGNIGLATGQNRDVTVILDATQAGTKELRLDLTGLHNPHISHNWTFPITAEEFSLSSSSQQEIAPRQSWPSSAPIKPNKAAPHSTESGFVFLAPQPLFDLPHLLSTRLQLHSFTTKEIADEIELLRLWRDTLLQADMLPEQKIVMRQKNLLLRLLHRQKPDGSFPQLPNGEADVVSTAAALTALSFSDLPLAKLATDQAAGWLHHRLDNSWFNEQERPERAAAYAALAMADRTDSANLHYFSDTSADKPLPPLAAAQLALAFAKAKDQDKAIFWLNAIKGVKEGVNIAPTLMPLLAENTFFDEHNLLPALEHISSGKPTELAPITAWLRSLWFVQNRAGTWRTTINNGAQNAKNILVVALPEKPATLNIHNPNDRSLFLTEVHEAKSSLSNDTSIMRHIYRMNGGEIMEGEVLDRNETYFVVTEGPWPTRDKKDDDNEDEELLVHDPVGPALNPFSCALSNSLEASDALSWIKNMSPSPITLCEKSGSTLDVLLPHTNNGAKTWRISYIAKPERSGLFIMSPIQIRLLNTDQDDGMHDNGLRQGTKTKLHIQ